MRLGEQAFDERDARGEQHGNGEADKHAQSTHAWRRHGMHVACTHFADCADFDGDVPDQRREQIGDATCDRGNEQVDSHAPKAPPFSVKALRMTSSRITPSRRIAMPSRSCGSAATTVDDTCPGVAPPSKYRSTASPSASAASCTVCALSSPERLALVAANGPVARRIRSATAELGMRTPCVALPVVGS